MYKNINIVDQKNSLGYIHHEVISVYSDWYKALLKKQFGDDIYNIFVDISEVDIYNDKYKEKPYIFKYTNDINWEDVIEIINCQAIIIKVDKSIHTAYILPTIQVAMIIANYFQMNDLHKVLVLSIKGHLFNFQCDLTNKIKDILMNTHKYNDIYNIDNIYYGISIKSTNIPSTTGRCGGSYYKYLVKCDMDTIKYIFNELIDVMKCHKFEVVNMLQYIIKCRPNLLVYLINNGIRFDDKMCIEALCKKYYDNGKIKCNLLKSFTYIINNVKKIDDSIKGISRLIRNIILSKNTKLIKTTIDKLDNVNMNIYWNSYSPGTHASQKYHTTPFRYICHVSSPNIIKYAMNTKSYIFGKFYKRSDIYGKNCDEFDPMGWLLMDLYKRYEKNHAFLKIIKYIISKINSDKLYHIYKDSMERYFYRATEYADDNLVKYWLDILVKQNFNFIKISQLYVEIDRNERIKNKEALKKLINPN